jgi:protein-tyrosine phosphatase
VDARGGCDDPFRVVFVCTGNRARSALAEALFERYARDVPAKATSAGTLDLEDAPALPQAIEAARRLGVDLSRHASRALSATDLSSADLVLGFEPEHVTMSVVEARADVARTFLLGELVALLDDPETEGDPCVRARSAVAFADARRIRSRPNPAHAVPDPYGKSPKVMQRIAREIDRQVRELVSGLFGTS